MTYIEKAQNGLKNMWQCKCKSSLINYSFYIFIHLWSFYSIYIGFSYRNKFYLFQLLRDYEHALAAHARRIRGKPHFKKETHKESHPPKNLQKYQKGNFK